MIAHVIYRRLVHPNVLREFVGQNPDRAPCVPMLKKFLEFRQGQLGGKLPLARVASCQLIKLAEIRCTRERFLLN
ncbi:MAG: Usg family protein [Rhodospirillaceae bacterium]|nr:Usg family protein [Rhodospirillaceae bacterium]